MDIKSYLIEKKEDIRDIEVKEREIKIRETKDFVTLISGPRRSGKTYLIYDFIKNKKKIEEEDYLFIDLEEFPINWKEIRELPYIHTQIYGKEPKYIFLDELQNIPEWEKGVRYLYEKKRYFIFATGSSSKILEIKSQLRGRYVSVNILPVSFREYVSQKIRIEKEICSERTISKIKHLLSKYILNGSFPDIVFEKIGPEKFYEEYLKSIILRDLGRSTIISEIFVSCLLSSTSSFFSPKKILNIIKSRGLKVSRRTIYRYFHRLKSSFIVFPIRKFSPSLKGESLSLAKVYFCDTGLVNQFSDVKFGKLFENFVFLELKRRLKPGEKISYWRDYQGREVDFVIHKKGKVKMLIQAAYELNKEDEERETESLLKASKELGTKNLFIITWDQEYEIKKNGKKIKVLPAWKVFLDLQGKIY